MTIFDSHTHIHFPDYDKDRDEVIKRAQAAGVKMITVGTDYQTSQDAIAIAEKYPDDIWATVGLHPTEAPSVIARAKPEAISRGNEEITALPRLREIARNDRVVAIGECGLDYFRIGKQEASVKVEQKQLFVEQIRLAQELKKPLMIHCRPSPGTEDAYEDLIAVIASPEGESVIASPRSRGGEAISVTDKRIAASSTTAVGTPRNDGNGVIASASDFLGTGSAKQSLDGADEIPRVKAPRDDNFLAPPRCDAGSQKICHFFAGSLGIAKQLLELGCYFTFGGVITFSRDYDGVIKFLPLEKILLETDAPYVAPVPYRGKRNEPAYVAEVAKKMAEIKGASYEEIARQTTENVMAVFIPITFRY